MLFCGKTQRARGMLGSVQRFVPLDSPLTSSSLVLLAAPAPFRMARVELGQSRPLGAGLGMLGFVNVGEADADIVLPGLGRFMIVHESGDSWRCMANGAIYGSGAQQGQSLPPYGTFSVGHYTFMFVPPTPNGLGIPPDYPSLTLEKKAPCTLPRLLVRAGHKSVMARTFPLHFPVITVGGALANHVPLFRLPFPTAARLTRVEETSFFVEPLIADVSVVGPRESVRILTPLASLMVSDWELVLLPPTPQGRPA
jgi:hypothetical protein